MGKLRKEQEILLELAKELKRVCEKHNLRYFLHAGSLLGAVRHQGFIPWDDDMDFSMPREDFEKIKELAKEEFKSPFFLQTEENTPQMCTGGRMRLRMDGTTGVQLIREMWDTFHQGICIDIVPLDVQEDDEVSREKQWKKMDLYAVLHYFKHYGKKIRKFSRLGWGRLKTRVIYLSSVCLSDNFLIKKQNEYMTRCMKDNNEFYMVSSEILGNYRHILLRKCFYDNCIMLSFEEEKFPAPLCINEILRMYYGEDCLEIPEEEKQKGHHNPILSTEQGYQEFLKPFQGIFKEIDGKEIVVFGAGQMLEHYLKYTKKKYHPQFVVDNDKKKWGKQVFGLNICAPDDIKLIPEDKQYIIICSIYYKEIIEQLKQMGINNYYIYVQNMAWL